NQNTDSPDLSKVMQTLDSMNRSYLTELNSYTKDYIDKNSGSLVTLLALYQQVAPRVYVLDPEKDIKYFVKVDSILYRKYPESGPVKALHGQVGALVESIEAAKGSSAFLSTGSEAPESSLPSPDGKIISLSSTRGKIVLLDFWAAWCPPCRQENPNLVKAYNAYRDKGFEIFQVSLDRTREAWLKGIEEDNLGRWIHVSDLKYWNSSVVPQYRIESIPHNFLLDREGRIIASDLRGQELQNRLAEIFKQ
ncbi:MAG: TlpA family protein disulfide reductase, partial [Bacteroidales bacterium]|nr:TlpA family protein disulfide reductase [Bacteroidales bacterium]